MDIRSVQKCGFDSRKRFPNGLFDLSQSLCALFGLLGGIKRKQHNGKMDRDDLIFAVSRNLGYKRLGKIVEATIAAAIQFAKTQGVIEGTGQISLVK